MKLRRTFLTALGLTILVPLSAAGLFIGRTLSWDLLLPQDFQDVFRLLFVLLLVLGLARTTYRFALKSREEWDEFAFLVVSACVINFAVQLSGGPKSSWALLYFFLAALASLAFPVRIVAPLVGILLVLETSNWLFHATGSATELLEFAGWLVTSALVFGFMSREERQRAEKVEEELQRLNLGLQHLTQTGEDSADQVASPLSEEGKRIGRVEYVRELDRRLGDLLKLARTATNAHAGFLIQSVDSEDTLLLRLSVDEDGTVSDATVTIHNGILEEALREERILAISERERPLPRFAWYDRQPLLHSLLAVPVRGQTGPGWAMILDHTDPNHFEGHRTQLAVALADQMSQWLSSTRQLADLDMLSGEFRRLYQASAGLSQARRVDQILQQILSFCREVSRFETCAICLKEEGEDTFSVPVAEGYSNKLRGARIPLDSPTWTGWILRSREEPLVIRIQKRPGMPILHAGERSTVGTSFLGIPLRAKDSVTGALLLTRKGEEFSANDVRVLRILCNQAAIAIENARVYERLEQLAATDGLTGLFNRRYFEQALTREVSRAERRGNSIALMILDIDHFKQLNDTYGHTVGDVVLKKVADLLSRAVRKGDVLARYGGEEFVILLPEASHHGTAEIAERIRKSISVAAIHPAGPRKRVTVSVGWALYPDDTRQTDKLIEFSDRALYFAKDTGRNRVAGYHILRAEVELP